MKHMHEYRWGVCSALGLALGVIGVCGKTARADGFYWFGNCETSNWFHTCSAGYCDPENLIGRYENNWGRVACSPDLPAYPGAADDVHLVNNDIDLNGDASVYFLSLDAGSRLGIQGDGYVYTLALAGPGLENDGTIVVNEAPVWGSAIRVETDALLSGSGDVQLNASGLGAELSSAPGATLTQAAGHLIHGRGVISAQLDNYGDIVADVSGSALELRTQDKTNNAIIQAIDAAYLDVADCTITQSASGGLWTMGGYLRLQNNATIVGGAFSGPSIFSNGTNTLTDVSLDSSVWLGTLGTSSMPTLTLTGSMIYNEGMIVVNYLPEWASAVNIGSNLTLSGGGRLQLNAVESNAQLNSAPGVTLTQAVGHTIRGQGEINAALVNDGDITADIPGAALWLRTYGKTNNSMMTAAGGELRLDGVTVTQSAQGRLLADGGVIHLEDGATVSGGTLEATSGGYLYNNLNNTLDQVTIAAGTELRTNGTSGTPTLTLSGPEITNHGTIVVNYAPSWASALAVANDLTLGGSGDIRLNSAGQNARLDTATGATLTQGSQHTIHGRGHVNAALVNNGTISADVNGQVLELRTKNKTNSGLIQATGGGYLDLNGITLSQTEDGELRSAGGTVRMQNGATIDGGTLSGGAINNEAFNTLSNVTLAADAWVGILGEFSRPTLTLAGSTVINNGTIVVNRNASRASALNVASNLTLAGSGNVLLNASSINAQLNTAAGVTLTQAAGHTIHGMSEINAALVNQGTIRADVSGQWLYLNPQSPGITNEGTIEVSTGSNLRIDSASLYTQTGGQTVVNGYLQVNGDVLNLQGGVIRGTGTVAAAVNNTGAAVEPGASAGTLTVNGSYAQAGGGELRIQLAGTGVGQFDKLAISGAASLAGTLHIEAIDGFVPQVGQQFTVMTFASRTGEFAAVTGPVACDVTYNATSVVVTVAAPPAPGDLDGDGDVDLDDFNVFADCLAGPAVTTPPAGCAPADFAEADLDADDDVDLADFGAFSGILANQ